MIEIDGIELTRLRDLTEGAVTVAAAHQAGLFQALGDGVSTAAEVAERARLDLRAVEIVLGALVAFGLLERRGDHFLPSETCRRHLCDPTDPEHTGDGLALWLRNVRAFTGLPEVLESGEPVERGGSESDEEALAGYMAAMAAAPRERIEKIVDGCLMRRPDAERVLDLGGGPGHMSRGFVRRGLEVTMVDTPETVAFVREEYDLEGVDGLTLVPADFRNDPLPEGPWDVVLLSNILHIYGPEENRDLLEKVGAVTASGGVAAVMDFVRGPSDRAPRFALVMLLRTDGGNTYDLGQIGEWLRAGGFDDVDLTDLDGDRQLVTGVRSPRSP